MKKTIYIFSNGELKRKDNSLTFIGEDGSKKNIPVANVKEIMLFGEFSLNRRLLNFLTQQNIIVHYFNYYGYYSGSFYPREHYNSGFMIVNQVKFYSDIPKRLFIAKQFVLGACENALKILKYYERREKNLSGTIAEIEYLKLEIENQTTIETLMSVEANIKKKYYGAFNNIVNNDDFKFIKREKRPPKDFINALISFSNSVIYTMCLSEIYQTHLDPKIGYLHASNFRRFSLNLDIAEIFKPVVGDRTIFKAINKKVITANDFNKDLNGILLNDTGKKKFLKFLEERLSDTIKHSSLKKKVSYRRLIRMELYKLEKHLMNEKEYKPFIMNW
ncbi:MAG: subtype I-B CRISPR-associated endonuclease Cas1 [Candidatus Cloacimonadota bacterium]|nr:MAG: subtype I-B CRISPR-associated endonuclease Cas1 [Candidatus Cloacimonadota bacterium]PIE78345.1 MAG: subtype I-B CRISPR-associated endonuclease Cas1 [Candidatus Delongbacteria bacterium]